MALKFLHRVVTSFEDATRNFEQLEQVFPPDANGNALFLQLLSSGKVAVAYGASTLTWPGGAPASTALVVTHNLGRIPQAIVCTPAVMSDGQGVAAIVGLSAGPSSTQFTAQGNIGGHFYNPANGVTCNFGWVAIG